MTGLEKMIYDNNIWRGCPLRIAVGTLMIFFALGGVASALSNDGGGSWLYSKDITINNPGAVLTDYQVMVTLDSGNFQFSHVQANGEDIRFTDSSDSELNYWIESWDAGNAKVWVKVTSVPAGASAIHMWWGNPSATSSSNWNGAILPYVDSQATASAGWIARTGHGSVVYNDAIWVMGGYYGNGHKNDVWYSSDGITWTQATSTAGWSPRAQLIALNFKNKLWVIGGAITGTDFNDVWSSSDGITWTQATASSFTPARRGTSGVVFNNQMWIVGGVSGWGPYPLYNDVWKSSDGITWTQATANAGWSPRYGHKLLAFDNKLWIIGGTNGITAYTDVWYSSDGTTWTRASANAGPGRMDEHSSVVFDNKMWVIGGHDVNYVWYSSDGISWSQATASAGWSARGGPSVVFNDKVWILGGEETAGTMKNDVWRMLRKYAFPEPSVNMGGGLVAEYHFDGDAKDSSGKGNDGTIFGGATFVDGISGNALNFNGVNDYVEVLDSASLDVSTEATFEGWIYPRSMASNTNVFQKVNGLADPNYMLYIGTSYEITGKRTFRPHISTDRAWDYGSIDFDAPENNWYYVAFTYKSSTGEMKGYINGREYLMVWSGEPVAGELIRVGTAPLLFGKDTRGEKWFNGLIDEFRIYNRALSADEIKANYDKLAPPTVTSISVSPSSTNVTVGSAQLFTATDQDSNPISVDWSSSDETVGIVAPTTGTSTTFTALKAGTAMVKAMSGDVEGSANVNVPDDIPPTTSISLSGTAGNNGWYMGDIIVTLTAADNEGGSGVERTEYTLDGTNWLSCSGSFIIANEGMTTIGFRSVDNAGNTEQIKNQEVKLDKTAPTLTINTPVSYGLYTVGTALSFSASDAPSGLEGDAVGLLTDAAGVTSSISTGLVPSPGVYTFVVTAIDIAGNTAQSEPRFFVVYDPTGGFATGGGWLIPDSESTLPGGRAIFGFVAKYKNGGSTGNLEFQYQDASINLKSTSIDWLTITGVSAIFQGTATINGEGSYKFRVTAKDNAELGAGTDTFDIMIWNETGSDIELYHKAKNVISGGNIVVHKK